MESEKRMLNEKDLIEIIVENQLASKDVLDAWTLEKVVASQSPERIYRFAIKNKKLSKESLEKLAEAVIQTEDAEYIYNFAKDIEGAPIDKLAEGIIQTEDAYCIYAFAKEVKGAPIDRLAEAVIQIDDAEYIYKFAKEVKGAPLKLILEHLLSKGYFGYMNKLITDLSLPILLESFNQEDIIEVNRNHFEGFIGFIEENKSILEGTLCIRLILEKMINEYEEYNKFLQVYIEYLLNPLMYSLENVKQLAEEYKEIVAEEMWVEEGKQKIKTQYV